MLNKLKVIKKGKSTTVLLNNVKIPMIKKMSIVEKESSCEIVLHILIDKDYQVLKA